MDIAECELSIQDSAPNTYPRVQIIHRPSDSRCTITMSGLSEAFGVQHIVGTDPPSLNVGNKSWGQIPQYVTQWAQNVKQYLDTPDLWAEAQHVSQIIRRLSLDSLEDTAFLDTPFTPTEQAEISSKLREIKRYVQETYSLSREQITRMEARFDDVERASRKLGRKDWMLLFLGAIFSLIITDTLTPDVAQHILGMALQGLQHLFGYQLGH
jgi:hypothetical protein